MYAPELYLDHLGTLQEPQGDRVAGTGACGTSALLRYPSKHIKHMSKSIEPIHWWHLRKESGPKFQNRYGL